MIKKILNFTLLLILFLICSINVNAEEVSGFSTAYYYSDITDVTTTTNFRTGDSNNVLLYGKEDYSPTYDNYEYITGFDNYIPYSVSSGTTYTVKVFWSSSSVQDSLFSISTFNARLNGLALVQAVNGVITYQKTTYTKNNCFSYMSEQYCNYNFITTYTFNATTNATAFRVGTYNNSAFSLYGVGNYLAQIVSVNSIDVIVNADNTIINQNEQIIDQNQAIIDSSNKTNEELGNLNDNLNDSDTSDATNEAGDFFSGFETDTFGLTSIITAPLNLIGSITSSSCSPLGLKVPFVENSTLNLPCMSTIYQKHFGSFLSVYQTITFGIIAYWVCVRVFALVKDFKNPDHDEIEVLDL